MWWCVRLIRLRILRLNEMATFMETTISNMFSRLQMFNCWIKYVEIGDLFQYKYPKAVDHGSSTCLLCISISCLSKKQKQWRFFYRLWNVEIPNGRVTAWNDLADVVIQNWQNSAKDTQKMNQQIWIGGGTTSTQIRRIVRQISAR